MNTTKFHDVIARKTPIAAAVASILLVYLYTFLLFLEESAIAFPSFAGGFHIPMTGARICVRPLASGIDCPADALFTSVAQEFGSNAIGVVLSGGDSDRALGIRAIKQAGGFTFAQHPGSARFPNTLISAIDTRCVDFVLRPNEIAHELARISQLKETAARGTLKHT